MSNFESNGLKASEGTRAEREWVEHVSATMPVAMAPEEMIVDTDALNSDRAARHLAARAELQVLQEKVAADKARRVSVATKVKALTNMLGSPVVGEDPAETAKWIQDLKVAQGELRDADVALVRSEQALAAREADYRKDFPEKLN